MVGNCTSQRFTLYTPEVWHGVQTGEMEELSGQPSGSLNGDLGQSRIKAHFAAQDW